MENLKQNLNFKPAPLQRRQDAGDVKILDVDCENFEIYNSNKMSAVSFPDTNSHAI